MRKQKGLKFGDKATVSAARQILFGQKKTKGLSRLLTF
jgi:hypothetical protein